jgi:hypothetical protein
MGAHHYARIITHLISPLEVRSALAGALIPEYVIPLYGGASHGNATVWWGMWNIAAIR